MAFTNEGSEAVAGRATAAVQSPSGQGPQTPQTPTTNPPNEGLYGEYSAQALKAYQDAQTAIAQRRSGIYQSYGFNQDGSVDGNNMVGQYQQLKHNEAMELDAAQNQALNRHLGTTGLGAQVAEAPRFQEGVDEANLGNSYLGALDQNSQDLTGAGATYQGALTDARRAQIDDDIANGRYDTPDPNPAADATPGARATAAAKRIAKTKAPTYTQGSAGRGSAYAPKPKAKPTPYRGRH